MLTIHVLLFVGWVTVIFICADLVGSSLWWRSYRSLPSNWDSAQTVSADVALEMPPSVQFGHTTLLGFAVLWAYLSVVFAFGVATQSFIVGLLGIAGLSSAAALGSNLAVWMRSRVWRWLAVAVVAALCLFARPTINIYDDPEYLFLIRKLLDTGSTIEYFNVRRPITLGGWTLIQATFAAGPTGTQFVASIDAVVGGVLFFLAAATLGLPTVPAIPVALTAVLAVHAFQINLGTAITLSAMSAILTVMSLQRSIPLRFVTPMVFAVMAVTIRPQTALIALAAIAASAWGMRAPSLLKAAAILVVLSSVWVLIFWRDTGFLPLSLSPGYNPQTYEPFDAYQTSLWLEMAVLWERQWLPLVVAVLAVVFWAGSEIASKSPNATRASFWFVSVLLASVAATVVAMIILAGPLSTRLHRYFMPLVEGVSYVYAVAVFAPYLVRAKLGNPSLYWALPVFVVATFCFAVLLSQARLSIPAETSSQICGQLLTPDERKDVMSLIGTEGKTLLAIECPVGSFDLSPRIMTNELFWVTRGDYVDIAWSAARIAAWLRKHEVGRLVYLENDTSASFGLAVADVYLRTIKDDTSPAGAQRRWEYNYWVEGLQMLRKLAALCGSRRVPIRDAQGPLVVVSLAECTVPDDNLLSRKQ